jgi:hypothetical protein
MVTPTVPYWTSRPALIVTELEKRVGSDSNEGPRFSKSVPEKAPGLVKPRQMS